MKRLFLLGALLCAGRLRRPVGAAPGHHPLSCRGRRCGRWLLPGRIADLLVVAERGQVAALALARRHERSDQGAGSLLRPDRPGLVTGWVTVRHRRHGRPWEMRMWLVDSDGTEARRVTSASTWEAPTGWNSDGKRVAFLSVIEGGQLATMVVDVDGGTPTRLIPEENAAPLRHLVPRREHAGGPDLRRRPGFNLAGRRRRVGTFGRSPPRASRIMQGHDRLVPRRYQPPLRVYPHRRWRPLGGSRWTGVRRGSSPTTSGRTSPYWSPDGQWIAFRSERGLQTDLWVVPAAGGPAERITDDVLREDLIGLAAGHQSGGVHHWPDPRQTLWAHTLADGAERQLTPDSVEASWFNLSSTGEVEATINRGGGVFDFTAMSLCRRGTAHHSGQCWRESRSVVAGRVKSRLLFGQGRLATTSG